MGDKAPAIGIDLGTTYCCVAFFQYPKVEIIPNDQGNRTTPSYVAFTDKERLIGDPAKDQMAENHANTVYNAKRLIGRRFNDESVQEDRRDFSFQVVNHVGKPKISVNCNGENKKYLPEQISAMILEKMKQVAEDYIGCEVRDAVITVPAYFNDAQRTATKTAGTIAGLNVIRIINEPTAAAIAFGLDQKTEGEKNVLIFDLGGGTFDVSILTIDDGIFKARATCGNTHLGGEDFDSRMVNHFVEEFQEVYDKDISEDKRALRRLRTACELAKRLLSSDNQASVQVPALFDGIDFKSTITRVKFEDLCIDLFESTLVPVEKALEDAKMKKSEIDEVILVGGSTRIPIIQKLLKEFFDGKELNKSIDPDEAVAYGAAVQAAILNGDKSDEIQDILLLDITPISLGMETEGGIMTSFFKRNSTIPKKETKYFSTTRDNQTSVMIQIYEGERALTKDNNYLGHFQLTGIPKAPRKEPQIEVTFEINANGILDVSAVEKSSGVQHKITIKPDKGRLNSDQIEQMVKDGEKGRTADEAIRKRISAQNLLRGTALQFKATVNQEAFTRAGMSQESKDQVIDKVKEVLKWINSNDNASFEDLDRKHKQLLAVCEPVLEQYKKKSAAFIGNSRPSPRADLAGISQGPSTSGNSSGNNNNNTNNNPRTGPKISELN